MTNPPTRRQRWRERKRYRRTSAVLAAVVAVLLAGGVAAGTWWSQHEEETNAVSPGTYVPPSSIMPTSATPTSSSTSTTAKTQKKSTTSTSSSSTTAATTSSSSTTSAPAGRAPAGDPTRVQVTSGGRELVDASLGPTKLDAQKVLAPPFGTAGWYAEPGWPKPGHQGASILVGHINHGGNPDVFWNLPSVKLGDIVTVTYGSGSTVKFKITRSQAAPKSGVPQDDTIWDWDNPKPVLRLITCDPGTPLSGGHYEGNWVVWADQMVS